MSLSLLDTAHTAQFQLGVCLGLGRISNPADGVHVIFSSSCHCVKEYRAYLLHNFITYFYKLSNICLFGHFQIGVQNQFCSELVMVGNVVIVLSDLQTQGRHTAVISSQLRLVVFGCHSKKCPRKQWSLDTWKNLPVIINF